jgi:hypothetical protein
MYEPHCQARRYHGIGQRRKQDRLCLPTTIGSQHDQDGESDERTRLKTCSKFKYILMHNEMD